MNVAFVAEDDPRDVRTWSGTPHHMLSALVAAGVRATPVGPLPTPLLPRARRYGHRLVGRRYLPGRAPSTLAAFAAHAAPLVADADLVLSPGSLAVTALRTPAPKVFWSDATFASMLGYYASFSGLSRSTIREGHAQEREAIRSAALCVYSSQWAADSAIRDYDADPARVRVIGFGANVRAPSAIAVEAMIDARAGRAPQLLFIGSDWHRKGGPFAVDVARRLGARLTVIGARPDLEAPHVRYLGWLDKSVPEQARAIEMELSAADFLILPTRAECTPIVFGEAAAYGVPVIAFDTGGVASVVSHDRNGLVFDPETPASHVAAEVGDAMGRYQQVARTSRAEYEQRLNWDTAVAAVLDACREVVGVGTGAKFRNGASTSLGCAR